MLIEKFKIINDKTGRLCTRYKWSCDWCSKQFIRTRCSKLPENRYCCRVCLHRSSASGKALDRMHQTSMERYGTMSPTQTIDVKNKAKKTSLDHFGVDHPLKSKLIRSKIEATNIERYGVKNVFQADNIKQKITRTLLDRYGVEHALQAPEFQEKFVQTCNKNFGVNYPGQSEEVKRQARVTYKQNYGVDHVFKDEKYKQDRKQIMLDRHGVECTLQMPHVRLASASKASWDKRINTMKTNGSFQISRPEELLYECLTNIYVNDIVRRQVRIKQIKKHWLIDFYIPSIDVYVQLDGVYWHGLDRPLDEIVLHTTKRDVQIHKRWLTDREQDHLFEERGLRLVRFTDIEVLKWQKEKTLASTIKQRLEMKK